MHSFAGRCGVVLLFAGAVLPAAAGADEPAGKDDMVLGDCLVLRPVGRSGRAPLHRDGLEAEIVAGRWAPPKAGDAATDADGAAAKWEEAKADGNGSISHKALGGGYLYWKVEADAPTVMLLEAAGHLMVYVNGEPRAGDPYENGIVRLPVALKKGANDFLFQCGRGRLRARLTPPAKPALLDTHDLTLPDFLAG
jgi:hypothetical protein